MYDIFIAKLQELNVPLYIHPEKQVPQAQISYGGYGFVAGSVQGFSVETILHALRVILAGAFDKWPTLRSCLDIVMKDSPFTSTELTNACDTCV
jgi:predicted TIM-barrel fold metal-dependent hydrolase